MIKLLKNNGASVLLGLFDGVHIGHRKAVETLMQEDNEKIVYTFCSFDVDTKGARKLILTDAEKEETLLKSGVDRVVFGDFKTVRHMSCREFAEKVLIDTLNAKTVLCGEDFRFGENASGGAKELESLCREYGMKFILIPTVTSKGETVSTTKIRTLIEAGEIKRANSLLGYSFFVSGEVVHGDSRGRKMGIRTINTLVPAEKLIPKSGVYSTDVMINGEKYLGITDIGTKPTVSSANAVGTETHILDYKGDLYGEKPVIYFKDFYREEQRFDSEAELIKTINCDIKRRKEEG